MKSLACSAMLLLLPLTSTAQDDAHPLQIEGDVVPPRLLTSRTDLKLSKEDKKTLRHQKSCDVTVEFVLTRSAEIQDTKVVELCDPLVDERALAMVSNYRFIPATFHGQPVAVKLRVQVHLRVF